MLGCLGLEGGNLGGGFFPIPLPAFTIGVRGTVLLGSLPDITKITPSSSGAVASAYTTSHQILGFPAVDAAPAPMVVGEALIPIEEKEMRVARQFGIAAALRHPDQYSGGQ